MKDSIKGFTPNILPKVASVRMHRLPPYLFGRINALKSELRRKGVDIIDLGMGNPNDPAPKMVVDKLAQAATDKRNQRYSASIGIYNLRKEVAALYKKQWAVDLDPQTEVIATIGSKEGFSHLCLATLGPGDVALVPTPTFPIHIYGPVIAGANVIGISMSNGDDKLLSNIAHMCRELYPRPKMLILNYPNNPTTHTVEIDFFKEVVKLAKKYNFYVIHDLAYGLTTFDGYKAPSFLQVKGAKKIGVESITMSKPYNMAGFRVGYLVGNKDMLKVLADIKGYYDYGMFQAIQIASIIALRHCDKEVATQAKVYQSRRDCLCAGLNRIGWQVEKPKASMFVWAPIPAEYRKMGSINFALKCLTDAKVVVSPGRGFGEEGEGFVRIALVENENRIKQAIKQLGITFPVKQA